MSLTATSTKILGQSVPPYTSHAISVSLPTWRDNVGYEEGEKRVVDVMANGYPRFFIQKSIEKVIHLFLLPVRKLKTSASWPTYARRNSADQESDVSFAHRSKQQSSVENS